MPLTHAHAVNDWTYCRVPPRSHRPITRGQVRDFGVLEGVLHHSLNCELQVYTPESKLLLTGNVVEGCPEELVQICFEKFDVPRLGFVPSPILAMYGTGRMEGLVVDIGHETTNIDICIDGQVHSPTSQRLLRGGSDLTDELRRLIMEANRKSGLGAKVMQEFGDLYMWDRIKERHGRLVLHGGGANEAWEAKDNLISRRLTLLRTAKLHCPSVRRMPQGDQQLLFQYMFEFDGGVPTGAEELPMRLPDGTEMILRNELTNFGEILFQPSNDVVIAAGSKTMHLSPGRKYGGRIRGDYPSLGEHYKRQTPQFEGFPSFSRKSSIDPSRIPSTQRGYWNAVESMHLTRQQRLMVQHNTILCGGTTLLPGFERRFRNEVSKRKGWGTLGVKVYAPEGREHLVWTGGSVLAVGSFAEGSLMSTREEYLESGSKIMKNRMEIFYSGTPTDEFKKEVVEEEDATVSTAALNYFVQQRQIEDEQAANRR
eukprot:Stramenopile-MAST_4_protein_3401